MRWRVRSMALCKIGEGNGTSFARGSVPGRSPEVRGAGAASTLDAGAEGQHHEASVRPRGMGEHVIRAQYRRIRRATLPTQALSPELSGRRPMHDTCAPLNYRRYSMLIG